jgi:putative CocE/NonD family hydrolase
MAVTIVDDQRRKTVEQHYGPLGPHTVELTDPVIVAADDGFELTGILALPVGVAEVPAVLIRTPYNPASFPPEVTAFFLGEVIAWASHGYACLVQSTRTSTSYFDEAADGAATVRWIERQPWFNGALGLTGASYHAFSSWATASTRPSSLKAIATAMYSTDRVSSWYPGGGFALELALSWTAMQQAQGTRLEQNPYNRLPLDEADVAATGSKLDFYQERLAHDGGDPHWHPLDYSALLDDPPAPVLHIGGWSDYHRTYSWQDFERLTKSGSSVPHRFVIGPWTHAAPDSRISMAERLAWFNTHVRGDGSSRSGVLRYYRTGADPGWVECADWREPGTTTFHVAAAGRLVDTSDDAFSRVEWTYDPADPTPSVAMATLGPGDVGGVWDSGPLEQRPDVCTFTSEPLSEPMDLAGRVRAATTFCSDAVSADLFLRLLDVHEDGQVRSVVDGFLRITDAGLADGVPVEIDLGPAGHRFAAGHRLRLLVSSGAHPYHNRNLGNGEPTATATSLRKAHQALVTPVTLTLPTEFPAS